MGSALRPEISRALHRKTPATCLGSSPRPSAELSFRFIRYLSEHSLGSPQLSCLALITPCLHPRSRARCHRYLCGYSLGSPQLSCLALITPYLRPRSRAGCHRYLCGYSLGSPQFLLPGARHALPSPALSRALSPLSLRLLTGLSPAPLAWGSSPPAFTRALALAAAAISAVTHWALPSSFAWRFIQLYNWIHCLALTGIHARFISSLCPVSARSVFQYQIYTSGKFECQSLF